MMSMSSQFKKACSITAAHFVTTDFTELTDERELWSKGFLLEDKTRGESIKIYSLLELELGVMYVTPRGSSLVRTARTEARLADKITLPVDLSDGLSLSPRNSWLADELMAENHDGGSAAIGSA